MGETLRIGPAHLFYGDPTVALGAGMTYLGRTKGGVSVTPSIKLAFGMADQDGHTPSADAVYRVGVSVIATTPLFDEEKAKLKLQLPGSSLVTASLLTALGLGSGFDKIAADDIGTLCILPVDQAEEGTNGIEATDAIWIPAAISNQFGDLVFRVPEEGDDSVYNPHEVQWAGLLRKVDHAAAAIPAAGRVMFSGPPGALGLVWTLPVAA